MSETSDALSALKKLAANSVNGIITGGITKIVDVEMTVGDSVNYAANDVIQGLKTITGIIRNPGGSCVIQSIEIVDGNDQGFNIDVHFFSRTIATAADNAAFAPTQAQLESHIPQVVTLSVWNSYNSIGVAAIKDLGIPFANQDTTSTTVIGTDIYMLLVAQGAFNFADADDLHVRLGLFVD